MSYKSCGTMQLIKALNNLPTDHAFKILCEMESKSLEDLYNEAIDFKDKYSNAFLRINDEVNRRLDCVIEKAQSEHVSTLDENAVEEEQ